jgi:fimbrial chaperone protein
MVTGPTRVSICGGIKAGFGAVALGCAALSVALPADAGTFTVSPVRIFMSPRDRAVAVTITNDGNEELVMQADVYAWSQKPDGSDDLVLSEDLILSPPILKMAPKSRQVVRLAVINRKPADRQVTYRLVVREVPEVKQAEKDIQMQVALAFSMPVFITPPGAKRNLQCTASRARPEAARVTCENTGSAYAQVREIVFTSAGGERITGRETGGYILPGMTRSFEIRKPEGRFAPGAYKLATSFDDGSNQSFDVTVPD